jgi:curved DNA-binding protein CbpA
LNNYYKILNIPFEASIDDLKHAYRKLAYKYHPDVSKLPNARELFIELNEAYEYLSNKLELENELRHRKAMGYEDTAQSIIDNWLIGERERIRNRANNYANMKFRNFKKTKIYRTTEILTNYLNIIILFFGILVFFGSVFGTWKQLSTRPKDIDFTYIASAFLVGLLGILITSYSVYKITTSLKANKN